MPTPGEIAERVLAAPVLRPVLAALGSEAGGVWVVGGAVRDAALGLEPAEADLAVAGDPAEIPRAISARAGRGAAPFELSGEFGTWRVVGRGEGAGAWQIDLTALRGPDIEADLAERDFTIGAMAVPLAAVSEAAGSATLLDPRGGLVDLAAGVLRAVSERSFESDPLRLLRAARLAAAHGLEIEPETRRLARAAAGRAAEPAGERRLDELRQLIGGPDPTRGLALLDELGALAPILPRLDDLRGVTQGPNHHLDVFDHTLTVLDGVIELEADPGSLLTVDRLAARAVAGAASAESAGPAAADPAELAQAVTDLLADPLADGMTRATALRFGALFHDIGKPETRKEGEGFVGFPGHDRAGQRIIGGIGRDLAMSRKLTHHLGNLALHHLRLGFLVPERPLRPRQVHAYLRATGEVAVDVTLLSAADRLAARGSGGLASQDMVRSHLELAAETVAAAIDWRRNGPPEPLLRGDELAAAVGLEPGPELGSLIEELEAARYAGEFSTRAEAIDHARDFLAGREPPVDRDASPPRDSPSEPDSSSR